MDYQDGFGTIYVRQVIVSSDDFGRTMRTHSLKINAVLNMIRRGSAMVFPLITFSYASHKLGASGMGAYSFSQSVISYFLLLAALGISTYAVREGQAYRGDIEALKIFISEVYTINLIMTVISYIALALLLLGWSKLTDYSQIILILSISIILTTLGADWVNTLLEDYLFITIRYIVVQVFCLVVLVFLVKEPGDVYKYAVIGMLSSVGGNVLNIVHIRKKIFFHLTIRPNFKKHLIPMFTLFSNSLAIKIYLLADVTILGIFFADNYVGYYSAASKVYTSIKEMLNAMILVTVPRFSFYLAHDNKEEYYSSYKKVFDSVVTLIVPCIVGLLFQADNILYFLGGQDYVNGAGALRILAFAMFFAVSACLFSQSILIPNKQEKYFLKATIVSAIVNIGLNFILIPFWGIEAAAFTTLLSEAVVCAMTFYIGRKYIDSIVIFNSDVKSTLIGTMGVIIVCAICAFLLEERFVNLAVSVSVSCLVYFVITFCMGNHIVRKMIKALLEKL